MNDPTTHFPEFGGRGDTLGARRTRRAFQLCVLSCVVFTGLLWFSENYLRHDRAEVLYQRALTLDAPSARVLLHQAIELDRGQAAYPSARYLEAMAERAESDEVLDYFEEAYAQDSHNPMLAIRYGCALLRRAQASQARALFREAAQAAPQNALPVYLEAAAMPWLAGDEAADLPQSLALVAKANSGGNPVLFPQPSWPGGIPRKGWWYAELHRQAVRESCELLHQYALRAAAEARRAIDAGQLRNWDAWLQTLETMGMRVASASQGGVTAARTGLIIQQIALEHRLRIAETENRDTHALRGKLAAIDEARAAISDFEDKRERRIASVLAARQIPMAVAGYSLAAVVALFLAAVAAGRAVGISRNHWTVNHSLPGIATPTVTGIAMLAALAIVSVVTRWPEGGGEITVFTQYVWGLALVAAAIFGVVYPGLRLPSAADVAEHHRNEAPLEDTELHGAAAASRRQAYVGLARRYYGLLLGAMICGVCAWIVGYRIMAELYPWDLRLMRTGLSEEETALVQQIISMLE